MEYYKAPCLDTETTWGIILTLALTARAWVADGPHCLSKPFTLYDFFLSVNYFLNLKIHCAIKLKVWLDRDIWK
jgi:hypothetical protein